MKTFRRSIFAFGFYGAILSLCLSPFNPAIASPGTPTIIIDETFGKAGGWSIGFGKSIGGCVAAATFKDETTIWFGFGGIHKTFLAFTNPKWRSVEVGQVYDLVLKARGQNTWKGTFVGFERENSKGVFIAGLKEKFIIDLASAGSMSLSLERREMTALALAGSTEAIEAVISCQKEYLNASTGETGKPKSTSDDTSSAKSEKSSQGTGFFVSDKGHILTNHHVIEGCTKIDVTRIGQASVSARLIASDKTNDLAILSSEVRFSDVPPLYVRARIGDSVYVYGYPLSGLLATTGNFTVGNITATAGLSDDSRMLQISAPVQPGNSGGPLVDQYGNVVGIIVSKLNALKIATITNDVAQNVNFAIKSTIAINFLDANGISAPIEALNSKRLDSADIADRAKQFTVRINCR